MVEGLSSLVSDIASIMAAPDADIEFLDKLLKVVLLRIHQPAHQGPGTAPGAAPGGPPSGEGIPGAGVPAGPPGGGAPNDQMVSAAAPEAPTQPGGVSKPMTPNPDEMRRILAEAAGR